MRGGGRGDVAPSPRERTVLAWGRPLIAKEMPIVIRRMERLNLRVPDVVGELLQARKNMGKARCPAGGLAGRHSVGVVVGARDGPKACSWWDGGAGLG